MKKKTTTSKCFVAFGIDFSSFSLAFSEWNERYLILFFQIQNNVHYIGYSIIMSNYTRFITRTARTMLQSEWFNHRCSWRLRLCDAWMSITGMVLTKDLFIYYPYNYHTHWIENASISSNSKYFSSSGIDGIAHHLTQRSVIHTLRIYWKKVSILIGSRFEVFRLFIVLQVYPFYKCIKWVLCI